MRQRLLLHALRHLDAEQRHTVLDGLAHVGGEHQAEGLGLVGLSREDAVVVVELVEELGELVAVVGDACGVVVLAGVGLRPS
jgi:hypothetical protein